MKTIYSVIPDLLEKSKEPRKEECISTVMMVVSSWVGVISRVMQTTYSDDLIKDTERHIKIFLSSLDDLDQLIQVLTAEANERKEKKEREKKKNGNGKGTFKKPKKIQKRKILSTPNVTSQLNLPYWMKEFGPLRNLWEGKYIGEGILLTVKEMLTQGTHMPWFAKAALEKFYNERSLECLLSRENDNTEGLNYEYKEKQLGTGYGHFVTYKNIGEIQKDILDGIPISALSIDQGNTVLVCVGRTEKKYYKLVLHDTTGTMLWCTWHTHIGVGEQTNIQHEHVEQAFSSSNLECILFLPNLAKKNIGTDNDGNKKYLYHAITQEWRERMYENDTVKYILPRVMNVQY